MCVLHNFFTAYELIENDRLKTVKDTGYQRAVQYDPLGDMWVDTSASSGIPLAGNTPRANVSNGKNQITSYGYDAAGDCWA